MSKTNESVSYTVLCVCTGNICRSPAAERLLAVALGPTVTVASAGTYAMKGDPISPPMDTFVEQAGGSAASFAARQLERGHPATGRPGASDDARSSASFRRAVAGIRPPRLHSSPVRQAGEAGRPD